MNPMDEPRKLKRGLKDISPLFGSETASRNIISIPRFAENAIRPRVDCLSIFGSELDSDASFLTAYLASKLTASDRPCAVVSLTDSSPSNASAGAGFYPRHFSFSWSQFESICRRPPERNSALQPQTIVLDFDYGCAAHFEKMIPILDQWILFVQPHIENLNETYKMIKASLPLNPHMDYFLLYDGEPADCRGSFLFEQFSEILSRRLGVALVWLGSLSLHRGKDFLAAELALDELHHRRRGLAADSLEKRSLAAAIQSGAGTPNAVAS